MSDSAGEEYLSDDHPETPTKQNNLKDQSVETLESKAEKNRERNREHAKRTRLRKKEMIEGMKMRLLELQREAARLEQLLEESNTANILLCLSVKPDPSNNANPVQDNLPSAESEDIKNRITVPKGNIIDQLRHKVRAEAARTFRDKYESMSSSSSRGRSGSIQSDDVKQNGSNDDDESLSGNQENGLTTTWQSGQTIDGADDASMNLKSLDPAHQKRERNRMHAKLTRDRKKLFTSRMQQTIQTLERHNQMMRNRLNNIIHSNNGVSASSSSSTTSTIPSTVPNPVNAGISIIPSHEMLLSAAASANESEMFVNSASKLLMMNYYHHHPAAMTAAVAAAAAAKTGNPPITTGAFVPVPAAYVNVGNLGLNMGMHPGLFPHPVSHSPVNFFPADISSANNESLPKKK